MDTETSPNGQDGKTKRDRIIELQVVPRIGEGLAGPGRPLYLDARRFVRICRWIEQGLSASEACRCEAVTYSSWRGHINRNAKFQKRLKKAEAVRFHLRHEMALASIVRAGEKNWAALAWFLERSAPNLWALKSVSRDVDEARPVGSEIPLEKLQEYGAQMAIFAQKESELREAATKRAESALLTNKPTN